MVRVMEHPKKLSWLWDRINPIAPAAYPFPPSALAAGPITAVRAWGLSLPATDAFGLGIAADNQQKTPHMIHPEGEAVRYMPLLFHFSQIQRIAPPEE